jgi:hypothetical protein
MNPLTGHQTNGRKSSASSRIHRPDCIGMADHGAYAQPRNLSLGSFEFSGMSRMWGALT